MPRPEKLDPADVVRRLAGLPGWELKDGKLRRGFVFKDFAEAFRFMTALAAEAERLNHHPEWSNVYNRVTIDLVTHDASGITALDFELAGRAQQLAGPGR
jgi:4a-hydroxytetrahydrobiopterin dehydratase